MLRVIVITFVIFLVLPLTALEIDEKLTSRILKVSTSKQTILINRGLEDGLVVGDHAKFFLTTGVVARGVVVKASPSRSIWSVYRKIEPQRIMPDQVLNLKIATPVKLTPDNSRMINPEPTFEPSTPTNVVLAAGADEENLTPDTKKELEAISSKDYEGDQLAIFGRFAEKSYEVFSEIGFSSMSSSSGGDSSSKTKSTTIDLTLGFEKYFPKVSDFWRRVSAVGIFGYDTSSSTSSSNGKSYTTSTMEVGAGAHYHFLEDPSVFGKLIGYSGLLLGVGKISEPDTSSTTNSETIASSVTSFTIPVGLKYYVRNGFGGRLSVNYESKSITTNYNDETIKTSASGLVFHIGLQYRF